MTDADESGEWAEYRVVVSRDGPRWMATAHGPGLPENGLPASLRRLADLAYEAAILVEQADTPVPGSRRSWHFEYELIPDGGDVLEGFRLAGRTYHEAYRERTGRGHEIASALAGDKATLREIAEIIGVDYWEAALLLAYRPRPHHLVRGFAPHYRWRREMGEWAEHEAAWRVRALRLVAEDKIREKRESRRRVRP